MDKIEKLKIVIGVLVVICIGLIFYGYYTYNNYQQLLSHYNTLSTNYQEQTTKNQNLQTLLNQANNNIASLETRTTNLESQIINLESEIANLEAELIRWKPTSGKAWLSEIGYVIKGNGEPVILIDYPTAKDPSWQQLLDFLKDDTTEQHSYTSTYVCGDFAEALHNNAEKAGIKTAFIGISFYGDTEMHALNAFRITDNSVSILTPDESYPIHSARGLTYIDDGSFDCLALVWVGKEYEMKLLWSSDKAIWEDPVLENSGIVKEITVIWEGK